MFIQNLLISQPRHFCQGIDKVMLIRSVLFNFQGAFLNSVFLISQTTLLLYHIFSSLSRGFLNFFQSFFQTILVLSKEATSFSKAFILYHIVSRLSRGFQNFFQSFLWPFRFRCALISSACLLYHLHRQKSTLFWKVFFIRYLCPIYLTLFQQYTAICTVARPFLHSFTYFTRAFSQTTNSFLYIFTQILVNL